MLYLFRFFIFPFSRFFFRLSWLVKSYVWFQCFDSFYLDTLYFSKEAAVLCTLVLLWLIRIANTTSKIIIQRIRTIFKQHQHGWLFLFERKAYQSTKKKRQEIKNLFWFDFFYGERFLLWDLGRYWFGAGRRVDPPADRNVDYWLDCNWNREAWYDRESTTYGY